MRVGAAALARELGLEGEVVLARGQAARPEADLASVLGQCVTPGGSDPMRSFSFLSSDGDRALLERLLGAFEPPPGAEDPRDPAGKGLVVWWHESLAAALDVTGFCSFSAAGLLADGVLDLDRLAELVLPASLAADEGFAGSPPGERLLALGASFVLAARALNREWGAPDLDRSAAFAEALDAPGMLALYRACRGLDARGAPTTDALAAAWTPRAGRPFGTRGDAPLRAQPSTEVEVGRVEGGGWWDRGAERAAPTGANASTREEPSASARPERAPGLVRLRAVGPLAERLGRARELRMALPASAREVLGAAAVRAPAAAAWLGVDERPGADGPGAEGPGAGAGADTRSAAPPAVYRDGRRLGADELVRDGDVLDLVLALAGG
jgi:hypothetical protein